MPTEVFGIPVLAVVLGLVEAAKRSGLSTAYCTPLALVLGLAASLGYQATLASVPSDWYRAVLWGLALGLSASGLYSSVKRIGEG